MLPLTSLVLASKTIMPALRTAIVPGIATAIVAFPLSIGLAVIAGVPPENMILASIYAALFNAVFAVSRYGVPGPNTAVALITGTAIAPYAPPESGIYLGYVFALCVMVGVIQLVLSAVLRHVDIMDYISKTVIDGLTMGIGLIFVLSSLNTALGLAPDFGNQWIVFNGFVSIVATFEGIANPFALTVAGTTILFGLICQRVTATKRFAIVAAVIAGTALGNALMAVTETRLETVGMLNLSLLATSLPDFRQVSWSTLFHLVGPAFAISLIGVIQTLSIAKGLREIREEYSPASEALSQGLQNLFMGFFHGVPVSNSFNKSVLMKQLGGNRAALVVGAGFTAGLVCWGSEFVATIPMPALSAALILVGIGMMDPRKHREHFRTGRLRLALLVTTILLTVVLSIEYALFVGALLAIAGHFWRFTRQTIAVNEIDGCLYVDLQGPWFFASGAITNRRIRNKLTQLSGRSFDTAIVDITQANIFFDDFIEADWVAELGSKCDCVRLIAWENQRHQVNALLAEHALPEICVEVSLSVSVRPSAQNAPCEGVNTTTKF